jgi:hypothetical protein
MITRVVIVSSVAVASLLAWVVRRYELSREPAPSPCETIITDVFSEGAGNVPDSLLLGQLLEHRAQCIKDRAYVDQARRLFLNTQRPDDARELVKDAERNGTFSADEMKAQLAWTDLADAHVAGTRDELPRANELRSRALGAANELRAKWPEWSIPYLILTEAERVSWKPKPGDGPNYYQIENEARGRVVNGAYVRSFSELQAIAFVLVIALIGVLALASGVSGLVAIREMNGLPASAIATAQPGYVKLTGTLHLTSNAPVVGPQSKAPSVWYEIARRSGMKGSTTMYERSSQPFILRDNTGDVVVEPRDMHVRTRHRVTKFGSTSAVGTSGSRVTEETLREGDSAYALGELSIGSAPGDGPRLRAAEDGRRLLVSNFDEAHLVFVERVWFWTGALVFVSAMLILVWSYHQRYHVVVAPGRLR